MDTQIAHSERSARVAEPVLESNELGITGTSVMEKDQYKQVTHSAQGVIVAPSATSTLECLSLVIGSECRVCLFVCLFILCASALETTDPRTCNATNATKKVIGSSGRSPPPSWRREHGLESGPSTSANPVTI